MHLPRAVAVTIAITAPATALATIAIRRLMPRQQRLALVAEYGIRNVPDRPPLWRSRPAAPATGPIRLTAVDPVPPENPHSPPTPPYGVRQVR
jgi:hypothetical protein